MTNASFHVENKGGRRVARKMGRLSEGLDRLVRGLGQLGETGQAGARAERLSLAGAGAETLSLAGAGAERLTLVCSLQEEVGLLQLLIGSTTITGRQREKEGVSTIPSRRRWGVSYSVLLLSLLSLGCLSLPLSLPFLSSLSWITLTYPHGPPPI